MTQAEAQLITNRSFIPAEHSVRICRQINPAVAAELRRRIHERFPETRGCQFINTANRGWGQFRIVRHRANFVPAELTNAVAVEMLNEIEAELNIGKDVMKPFGF